MPKTGKPNTAKTNKKPKTEKPKKPKPKKQNQKNKTKKNKKNKKNNFEELFDVRADNQPLPGVPPIFCFVFFFFGFFGFGFFGFPVFVFLLCGYSEFAARKQQKCSGLILPPNLFLRVGVGGGGGVLKQPVQVN